jgi:hypothetical protein
MLDWICPECGRECAPGERECAACHPGRAATANGVPSTIGGVPVAVLPEDPPPAQGVAAESSAPETNLEPPREMRGECCGLATDTELGGQATAPVDQIGGVVAGATVAPSCDLSRISLALQVAQNKPAETVPADIAPLREIFSGCPVAIETELVQHAVDREIEGLAAQSTDAPAREFAETASGATIQLAQDASAEAAAEPVAPPRETPERSPISSVDCGELVVDTQLAHPAAPAAFAAPLRETPIDRPGMLAAPSSELQCIDVSLQFAQHAIEEAVPDNELLNRKLPDCPDAEPVHQAAASAAEIAHLVERPAEENHEADAEWCDVPTSEPAGAALLACSANPHRPPVEQPAADAPDRPATRPLPLLPAGTPMAPVSQRYRAMAVPDAAAAQPENSPEPYPPSAECVIEVEAVPVDCTAVVPAVSAPPAGGVRADSVFGPWPPGALFPGWLGSLVFAFVLFASGAGVLWSLLSGPDARDAIEASTAVAPGPAPVARNWSSRVLTKYVEVTGMRISSDLNGRASVQFLVVNHSGASIRDATVRVTVRSDSQDRPLFNFTFALPELGPYESREMGTGIQAPLRLLDMPNWNNLRADVQVNAP